MVGNWLLMLRERMDHQPRLQPYPLSGLCDESPAIVQVRPKGIQQPQGACYFVGWDSACINCMRGHPRTIMSICDVVQGTSALHIAVPL
jgi:hypothetical protein